MAKVYLGIPFYGDKIGWGIPGALMRASKRAGCLSHYRMQSFSVLPRNFNMLYAEALNSRKEGVTHFCMLHDDIVIEDYWLDKMLDIQERVKADVLSVVSPIKDGRGLTSTALDIPMTDFMGEYTPRRLTLHEIFEKYEPTFTDEKILLNTAVMLVRINNDWADKISFDFDEKIVKNPSGNFEAFGMSEDWLYSRRAKAHGAKLFATREVLINHLGPTKYYNAKPWGEWTEDRQIT